MFCARNVEDHYGGTGAQKKLIQEINDPSTLSLQDKVQAKVGPPPRNRQAPQQSACLALIGTSIGGKQFLIYGFILFIVLQNSRKSTFEQTPTRRLLREAYLC